MRRFVFCLVFVLGMLVPTIGFGQVSIWDAAFEADPAVNDPVSEGDDHIRQSKENVRYRAEVESWHGDTAPAWDNGLHRMGSARCFMDTADPTTLTNGMSDFANDGTAGDTDLDNVSFNSGGATDDTDIGHGRCYVDIDGPDNLAATDDDYTMYIYQGVAGAGGGGWEPVVSNSPYESSDDEILAGSYNLIYNGSFEATDGTGSPASILVPEGWAVVVGDTPGYTYINASTDVRYGDGYHLILANTGAANEGMRQTITNLNANSTYKLMARVQDDGPVGAVVCRLDIVNETVATGLPADSTNPAVAAWETIGGTFTTGAVVTTVDVEIYPIGIAGESCMLDHFALYEIGNTGTDRDEISEPGVWKTRGEYAAGTGDIICGAAYGAGNCLETTTGLVVTVTPPTVGNPLILIEGFLHFSSAGAAAGCEARLRNVTNNITYQEIFWPQAGGFETFPFHASVITHTPGTTAVYALQLRENPSGAGDCTLEDYGDNYIEAIVIPTR